MPIISFTTLTPDLPYLNLKNTLFEPNMFKADTVYTVYPLYIIKNNLTI